VRAIHRPPLPPPAQRCLDRLQGQVNAQLSTNAVDFWKKHRIELNESGVTEALQRMAGPRQRCSFCLDSRATTIEHYWPKRRFPARMYSWPNLLWVCGPCNLKKGEKFPIDPSGLPLVLNPSVCEPWAHLYFIPETGQITPRFDRMTASDDPVGSATTDPQILPLNVEAVTRARTAAWRMLTREVRRFLLAPSGPAEAELREAYRDCERVDVAIWSLAWEGAEEEPFASLGGDLRILLLRELEPIVPDPSTAPPT